MRVGGQRVHAVGAERVERAMGEVEDAGDAEHQREADREQRVDRADDGAINQDLQHGGSPGHRNYEPRLRSNAEARRVSWSGDQLLAIQGGLIILPVANSFGHTTTRSPFACHCTNSSLTKPGPSLTSWESSNCTRPRTPT